MPPTQKQPQPQQNPPASVPKYRAVRADYHSLFRSISVCFTGSEDHHHLFRKIIADELQKNLESLFPALLVSPPSPSPDQPESDSPDDHPDQTEPPNHILSSPSAIPGQPTSINHIPTSINPNCYHEYVLGDFKRHPTDVGDFKRYCTDIVSSGWGGILELCALSNVFEITIGVFDESMSEWSGIFSPNPTRIISPATSSSTTAAPAATIALVYRGGSHYDVIIPDDIDNDNNSIDSDDLAKLPVPQLITHFKSQNRLCPMSIDTTTLPQIPKRSIKFTQQSSNTSDSDSTHFKSKPHQGKEMANFEDKLGKHIRLNLKKKLDELEDIQPLLTSLAWLFDSELFEACSNRLSDSSDMKKLLAQFQGDSNGNTKYTNNFSLKPDAHNRIYRLFCWLIGEAKIDRDIEAAISECLYKGSFVSPHFGYMSIYVALDRHHLEIGLMSPLYANPDEPVKTKEQGDSTRGIIHKKRFELSSAELSSTTREKAQKALAIQIQKFVKDLVNLMADVFLITSKTDVKFHRLDKLFIGKKFGNSLLYTFNMSLPVFNDDNTQQSPLKMAYMRYIRQVFHWTQLTPDRSRILVPPHFFKRMRCPNQHFNSAAKKLALGDPIEGLERVYHVGPYIVCAASRSVPSLAPVSSSANSSTTSTNSNKAQSQQTPVFVPSAKSVSTNSFSNHKPSNQQSNQLLQHDTLESSSSASRQSSNASTNSTDDGCAIHCGISSVECVNLDDIFRQSMDKLGKRPSPESWNRLFCALKTLRSRGLVHCDFRASNVVVNGDTFNICDYEHIVPCNFDNEEAAVSVLWPLGTLVLKQQMDKFINSYNTQNSMNKNALESKLYDHLIMGKFEKLMGAKKQQFTSTLLTVCNEFERCMKSNQLPVVTDSWVPHLLSYDDFIKIGSSSSPDSGELLERCIYLLARACNQPNNKLKDQINDFITVAEIQPLLPIPTFEGDLRDVSRDQQQLSQLAKKLFLPDKANNDLTHDHVLSNVIPGWLQFLSYFGFVLEMNAIESEFDSPSSTFDRMCKIPFKLVKTIECLKSGSFP